MCFSKADLLRVIGQFDVLFSEGIARDAKEVVPSREEILERKEVFTRSAQNLFRDYPLDIPPRVGTTRYNRVMELAEKIFSFCRFHLKQRLALSILLDINMCGLNIDMDQIRSFYKVIYGHEIVVSLRKKRGTAKDDLVLLEGVNIEKFLTTWNENDKRALREIGEGKGIFSFRSDFSGIGLDFLTYIR